MIDNTSKISLSFQEAGEVIKTFGKYESANLNRQDEITKPIRIIQEPEYKSSKKHVILGNAFIQQALERPAKPSRRGSHLDFKIWSSWNKLSIKAKLDYRVKELVKSLDGYQPEWKLV